MANINEVGRQRRAFWREMKRRIRALDTAQERLERTSARILARKRNIPTDSDLAEGLSQAREVENRLLAVAELLADGYEL